MSRASRDGFRPRFFVTQGGSGVNGAEKSVTSRPDGLEVAAFSPPLALGPPWATKNRGRKPPLLARRMRRFLGRPGARHSPHL